MVSTRLAAALSVALAALLAAGACASKQDVPDDSSKEKPQYASTKEGSSSSDSKATGEGDSSGESAEARGPAGSARGGSGKPPKATGPVAHVDGEPIPAKKFNDEIEKVAKTGKFPPSLLDKFKGRLIARLIDQHLIDRAVENAKIEVSDKEVEKEMKKVRKRFDEAAKKRGTKQSLEQVAKKYGISDGELRDSIRRSLAIEKLLVKKGLELPTRKEVQKFYEKNKKKFTRPEQVHAKHILAKVAPDAGDEKWKEAKKRIEKVREKAVSDGTEFSKLAKEKSDGPSAKNGGDIGYISRKQFDPAFTKAAFKLKKGEISKPVKTKYGWHIIKAVDKRKSKTVPFEEVEGKLTDQLENKRVQKQLQKFLGDLRKKAEIEKHPENIE